MKPRWIVFFLLVGTLVHGIDVPKASKSGGNSFPKPTAEITSFRLEGLSLREATFRFELTVNNPYPVELPIDGLSLDFLVEGSKVFASKNQGKFHVPANKKKSTTFEVVLSYEGIIALVKNYAEKDWLQTDIEGQLTIALPKLPGVPPNIAFDYHLRQNIPALKPEVTLVGFTVEGPSEAQIAEAKGNLKLDVKAIWEGFKALLSGKKPADFDPQKLDVPLTVSYTLAIENKAKGPLTFKKLGYGLEINDQKLVEGESSQVVQDGPRTLITVVNTFRSKQLSAGVQEIFQKRKGQFRVTGQALLEVPPSVRQEPVPLAFNETGSFSLQ